MLDAKLAAWSALYGRVREAQARLNTPDQTCSVSELRAEADRLQRESDAALQALQMEFDAMKKRQKNGDARAA